MLAYTDDEKVELVEEYATLRHGLKGPDVEEVQT